MVRTLAPEGRHFAMTQIRFVALMALRFDVMTGPSSQGGKELRRMSYAAVQVVAEILDWLEADEGTGYIDLSK